MPPPPSTGPRSALLRTSSVPSPAPCAPSKKAVPSLDHGTLSSKARAVVQALLCCSLQPKATRPRSTLRHLVDGKPSTSSRVVLQRQARRRALRPNAYPGPAHRVHLPLQHRTRYGCLGTPADARGQAGWDGSTALERGPSATRQRREGRRRARDNAGQAAQEHRRPRRGDRQPAAGVSRRSSPVVFDAPRPAERRRTVLLRPLHAPRLDDRPLRRSFDVVDPPSRIERALGRLPARLSLAAVPSPRLPDQRPARRLLRRGHDARRRVSGLREVALDVHQPGVALPRERRRLDRELVPVVRAAVAAHVRRPRLCTRRARADARVLTVAVGRQHPVPPRLSLAPDVRARSVEPGIDFEPGVERSRRGVVTARRSCRRARRGGRRRRSGRARRRCARAVRGDDPQHPDLHLSLPATFPLAVQAHRHLRQLLQAHLPLDADPLPRLGHDPLERASLERSELVPRRARLDAEHVRPSSLWDRDGLHRQDARHLCRGVWSVRAGGRAGGGLSARLCPRATTSPPCCQ